MNYKTGDNKCYTSVSPTSVEPALIVVGRVKKKIIVDNPVPKKSSRLRVPDPVQKILLPPAVKKNIFTNLM